MKKAALFNTLTLSSILIPAVAFAQNFTYVNNWLNQALYWLRLSITIIMILMTVFFLWTVFQYISAKDAATQKLKKDLMIQGIIGLFVSIGVWGIIHIAGGVLGVDTSGSGVGTPGITCPPGLAYSPSTHTCN